MKILLIVKSFLNIFRLLVCTAYENVTWSFYVGGGGIGKFLCLGATN